MSAIVACSRKASRAILAFKAASIFRLVLLLICRSVCCNGTASSPISQPVPQSGSTSFETPVLNPAGRGATSQPITKRAQANPTGCPSQAYDEGSTPFTRSKLINTLEPPALHGGRLSGLAKIWQSDGPSARVHRRTNRVPSCNRESRPGLKTSSRGSEGRGPIPIDLPSTAQRCQFSRVYVSQFASGSTRAVYGLAIRV